VQAKGGAGVSSLAWIDFDEAERQRAQRIMALFQERESRDELGLGAIRDSIADHLFPGTSTIQTRLRYMLFVPWILRMVEDRDAAPSQLMAEARSLEIKLADALKAGHETIGIIGSDAGPRLQRLPSSIYWAGLGTWGIRVFPGSPDSYFSSLRDLRRARRRVQEGEEAAPDARVTQIWHPALPTMPKTLLEAANFRLTIDEAQFIIDRLIGERREALLTTLAREGIDADCDYIWEHPNLADFPAAARRLVRHAELFSSVMHGAALIYNLQLSELRARDDWIAGYEEKSQQWAAELDLSAVRAWSLDDFWKTVEHPAHSIRLTAKRFVSDWLYQVCADAAGASSSKPARQLIQERERRLKTSQSRFSNRAARDRWGGASGAERLNFRWPQARAHLRDLAHAE
jgi:hypothetical protein